MSCLPANVENGEVEMGIKTEFSTEQPYVDNEVDFLESESTTDLEMEVKCITPDPSESSIAAMDSGKPGGL
jgi:hypothetical protein